MSTRVLHGSSFPCRQFATNMDRLFRQSTPVWTGLPPGCFTSAQAHQAVSFTIMVTCTGALRTRRFLRRVGKTHMWTCLQRGAACSREPLTNKTAFHILPAAKAWQHLLSKQKSSNTFGFVSFQKQHANSTTAVTTHVHLVYWIFCSTKLSVYTMLTRSPVPCYKHLYLIFLMTHRNGSETKKVDWIHDEELRPSPDFITYVPIANLLTNGQLMAI